MKLQLAAEKLLLDDTAETSETDARRARSRDCARVLADSNSQDGGCSAGGCLLFTDCTFLPAAVILALHQGKRQSAALLQERMANEADDDSSPLKYQVRNHNALSTNRH
jgi:hypothetical protein